MAVTGPRPGKEPLAAEDALIFAIPVLALALGFVAILKLPRRAFGARSSPEPEARVQALEQEVGALREQLGETQERLDFTERLLARANDRRHLDQES